MNYKESDLPVILVETISLTHDNWKIDNWKLKIREYRIGCQVPLRWR